MSPIKILVAQGGGPTAVINQSLVGVVLEARRFPAGRARLRRAARRARHRRRGARRPRRRRRCTTSRRSRARPRRRSAPRATSPTSNTARRSSSVLRAHDIATSSTSAATIPRTPCASSPRRRARPAIRCAASTSPRRSTTISSASTTRPAIPRPRASSRRRSRAPTSTMPRCRASIVAVVMGRHAGFLTAAAALARKFPDDGPHLIYLPERTFSIDKFLADVKATYEKHGRCVIAVSEGIHDESGAPIIAEARQERRARRARQRAAFGHRRAGRSAVRGDQGQARHQARARRHLRLSAALVPRLRLRRRPARGARGRREGGAIRDVGRHATARSRSAAVGDYAVDYPLHAARDRRRQDARDGGRVHRRRPATT